MFCSDCWSSVAPGYDSNDIPAYERELLAVIQFFLAGEGQN